MVSRPLPPSARRRAARRVTAAVCVAALLGAGLSALTGPATAAGRAKPFHVSPAGSDSGDGSVAHPWQSIAAATALAPAGARIVVASGTYQPFTITQPGQTIVAAPGQTVVVQGRPGISDVIRVAASAVTLNGLTVTGCVPNGSPAGGLEDAGSSDVRIDDGTTGVILRQLTVTSSRGVNASGLPIGCYGIFAHHANAFRVVANDISGTGAGVYVNGGGQQAVIAHNRIHDNNVIIRDTSGGNDDFGGNGINLANVSAVPGVLATHNTLVNNQGPSSDYGTDGGGFEIFNASNTQMVGNTIGNNDVALETGTSPGGVCAGNVFSGNQVTGRSAGSSLSRSPGLLLRCATAMVISQNTFTNLDWWVYDIQVDDVFSTDVDGLAITGNTVTQGQATRTVDNQAGAPVYWLGVDPATAHLVINGNRFPTVSSVFATYVPGYGNYENSPTLADWQARTGQDTASLSR